ncbi:MAG TPA: hypothetical protein VJV23_09350 [Candidatus Polarisedimenticolia bacterium]|nr:hypothetical protein [Candidatus Polarisedimenticolia bacterium]
MSRAAAAPGLAVLLLAAATLAACGASYEPAGGGGREEPRPLASLYDLMIAIADLSFPLLGAQGLVADVTVAIDPASLGASGAFDAAVTVQGVTVGGVPRGFRAASPLAAHGMASGGDWALDSFGPIEIGSDAGGWTSVMLSVTGILSPDGRTIAGAAVATSSGETGTFHGVKQRRYLVAATDFGVVGTVSVITVRYNTQFGVRRDLEAVSGDPVARVRDGSVFIVNRFFFDNIQTLDPEASFRATLQFSTGNGSNPHDVAVSDDGRLFITRYEPPYNDLLIVSRTGAFEGFVDLSAWADNRSGTPRPDGLARAGHLLFVGMQNIDDAFQDYGAGRVAVVDTRTSEVASVIVMEGRNPFGPPAIHPRTGRQYWAAAGVFQGRLPGELSGGIEVIDPESLASLGLLVDDDDLGGNVSSVALSETPAGVAGFCIVTLPGGVNALRRFHADTGAVAPGTLHSATAFLTEVVADGDGYLLVPEHDPSRPRLLVFDAATGTLAGSLPLSLPPFSAAILTRTVRGAP